MGELGPSPPTVQAVDREISLDVMNEDQMGVLARKPGLLHDGGNHLLSAALDDALRHAHPDAFATAQLEELARLVQVHRGGRVAVLELGVGLRNGVIKRMLAGMAGFEVRSEDVPRCPHCGW